MIKIQATVNVPLEKAWELWNQAEHIKNWSFAADSWHCPAAENNLEEDGKFSYRMEAKDGSFGFDFGGKYTSIAQGEHLAYTLDDNRKVDVHFETAGDRTLITQSFEPEKENPEEMQEGGWQAILNNFKKYAETQN